MLFTPIKPMTLALRYDVFDDDRYLYEPKWDGWRILIHKQSDRIEAYTRNGRIVTTKFPELSAAREAIRADTAIIDCEGVCIRDGRSIFDDFQFRGRLLNRRRITEAAATHPATFVAFDVLYADGTDITGRPLTERKEILNAILAPSKVLVPTMGVRGEGIALKKETERLGWEGIVAKPLDSRYIMGVESSIWLKFKNWREIDCVILGYRLDPHFGLVVGINFPTVRNKPIAIVEWGFKPEERLAFLELAPQLHTHTEQNIQWIEPRLCCRVQYLERTELHYLRHVTFKGFVFDKRPEDCIWRN